MKDLIHPKNEGFADRITPKDPKEEEGVFFFKCKKCEGIHFRHAGYVKTLMPFMRPRNEKRLDVANQQVMVCVKCKSSFVWINEQMYEVTDMIDLKAWEKTEKEMHRATGPGGDC